MEKLLPRAARISAFIASPLTFFIAASIRTESPGLATLMSATATVATLLLLWDTGGPRAAWVSAGLWSGLLYVSASSVGIVYLVVALLAALKAIQRERAMGRFDLLGPLACLVAMGVVVLVRGVVG